MNTNTFKNFIKLGLAATAISLSMGAMAHGTGDKTTPNLLYNSSIQITQDNHVDLAKQVATESAANHQYFSSDKFLKKYHIKGDNIKITPLYLKEGMPFNWKNSQILTDPENPNKFNIVIVLDQKGNLYGVDQDFKGKNALNQNEKDLLLEQTLLHEYAHTYFFHGKKVTSSKLNAEENKVFNDTFLSKYQSLSPNAVYMESAAEISSTIMLINNNQQQQNNVKGLLQKINEVEVAERNSIIDEGGYDSHLMMYKGQQKVLKDFNSFHNMNTQDILSYTQLLTSDLVVEYATKFNEKYKLLQALDGRHFNEVSLLNTMKDLKDGKSLSQDHYNPTLLEHAKTLMETYPELKKEIEFTEEKDGLSLNLKTLYIAANVNTDNMYVTQLNYGDMDDARSDIIFDAVTKSVTKLMKNETTAKASDLINKLDSQYKASPTTFDSLPNYTISHSLAPIVKKSSVMDNIKKMKEQSLSSNHNNTLKM